MSSDKSYHKVMLPYWALHLALFVVLYLMYSSSFTLDYLMNDEMDIVGKSFIPPLDLGRTYFASYGRFLFGFGLALELRFIHYDPFRIEVVRYLNFISIALMALALFQFLSRSSKSDIPAFFTVLLLFSQLSFQLLIGYSLLLLFSSQLAMWLSLIAFYLHFYYFQDKQKQGWRQNTLVVILLMASMQSTQTYGFFAMVPLTYLALTEGEQRRKQILVFFALAAASFLLSSLSYKLTLEFWPGKSIQKYELGQANMTAVFSQPLDVLFRALNPFTYWSAFKFWSYPFPFHNLKPFGALKPILATSIMVLWLGLVIAAYLTERSFAGPEQKRTKLFNWLMAMFCLAFSGVFIIADTPLQIADHRAHITLTMSGVVIFSSFYALQTLVTAYGAFNKSVFKYVAVAGVLATALGAQSGVLSGIVNSRQDQLVFIRAELSAKHPDDFNRVIVLMDTTGQCHTEPCDPQFGLITHVSEWYENRDARYRYALATLGINPASKQIEFVKAPPQQVAEGDLLVDWRKYVQSKQRHSEFLK